MLPYWLDHHKGLFDHGIVIEYGSVDRTVEILHDKCPTWEVHKNRYGWGPAFEDVQMHEKRVHGTNVWKIALNVTEFVMENDLHGFIETFVKQHPLAVGIRTCGVNIVDRNDNSRHDRITDHKELIMRKHFGYYDHDLFKIDVNIETHGQLIVDTKMYIERDMDGRSRLLHKAPQGLYNNGRHGTSLTNVYPRSKGLCPESPLVLAWFGYAPYYITKDRMSRRWQEYDYAGLFRYQNLLAYDLLTDPRYKEVYHKLVAKETITH